MGFEPTTFSLARRRSTTEPRPHIRPKLQAESAESQNRTGDTAIFSRVLYQLSYLGLKVSGLSTLFYKRANFNRPILDCQVFYHTYDTPVIYNSVDSNTRFSLVLLCGPHVLCG